MATQAMGIIGELRVSGSPQLLYNLISPDFSRQPKRPNTPFAEPDDYPTSVVIFNQRRIYVSTVNNPLTLFASAVGNYTDFSDAFGEDTAFELELDSKSFDPVNYVVASQFGLLLFSERNIWLVVNRDGGGLTAVQAFIKSELTSGGKRNLEPLRVLNNIIFISNLDNTPRVFVPVNTTPNQFDTQDISLYSSHFFDKREASLVQVSFEQETGIIAWTYAGRPDRLLWAVRHDGLLLSCAYAPEHRVNAWGKHSTKGKFIDVQSVYEGDRDAVYVVVERGGHKYVERMADNSLPRLEDSTPVDAAVRTGTIKPQSLTTLYIREYTDGIWVSPESSLPNTDPWFEDYTGLGVVLEDTSTLEFASAYEGDLLCTSGGAYRITEYIADSSGAAAKIEVVTEVGLDDTTYFILGTNHRHPIISWEIINETSLYNCFHLQSQDIYAIEQGAVSTDRVVSATGTIAVNDVVNRGLVVGFPFKSSFRSLPFISTEATLENKLKNLRGMGLRCLHSSSMKAGLGDNLYPVIFDGGEESVAFRSGVFNVQLAGEWELDDPLMIESMLPFNILGMVFELDPGDLQARRTQVTGTPRISI